MKKLTKLYFCEHCKKIYDNISQLVFVEEKPNRGFCNEVCIEGFYSPMIGHFNKIEEEIQEKHGMQKEERIKLMNSIDNLDYNFVNPDEVWLISTELDDNFYIYIKEIKKEEEIYYLISICLVYENKPSFVFLMTITKSIDVLNEFRQGVQLSNVDDYREKNNLSGGANSSDFEISDPDIRNFLDTKKSTILSWIIANHTSNDIAIEDYSEYIQFIKSTLDDPDEIYKWEDIEGDTLLSYLKGHEYQGKSFYYLVICIYYQNNLGKKLVLPVLSFPSLDSDICHNFKQGECVSGGLKS